MPINYVAIKFKNDSGITQDVSINKSDFEPEVTLNHLLTKTFFSAHPKRWQQENRQVKFTYNGVVIDPADYDKPLVELLKIADSDTYFILQASIGDPGQKYDDIPMPVKDEEVSKPDHKHKHVTLTGQEHEREVDLQLKEQLSSDKPDEDAITALLDSGKFRNLDLSSTHGWGWNLSKAGKEALVNALKRTTAKIRFINLNNQDLGEDGAVLIAAFLQHPNAQVKSLELANTKIGDQGMATICAALQVTTAPLRNLDFGMNEIGIKGIRSLVAALPKITCPIQFLSFQQNSIGNEGAIELGLALNNNDNLPVLRTLDLATNNLTDGCIDAFQKCWLGRRLIISFLDVRITYQQEQLMDIRNSKHAEQYHYPSKYKAVCLKPLAADSPLKSMPLALKSRGLIPAYKILRDYTKGNSRFWTTFYIHRGRKHWEFVAGLVTDIENGKITEFNTLMKRLSDYRDQQIATNKNFNFSGSFNRRFNFINDVIVEQLQAQSDQEKPQAVAAPDHKHTPGAKENTAMQLARIQQRELMSKKLIAQVSSETPDYAIILNLLDSKNFYDLNLSASKMTSAGLSSLLDALVNTTATIKNIDLSGNKIDANHAEQIAKFITTEKVRRLCLANCNINVAALGIICEALKTTEAPIQFIDLDGNDFGNAGIKLLATTLENSSNIPELRHLSLQSNNIDNDSIQALQKCWQQRNLHIELGAGPSISRAAQKQIDANNNTKKSPFYVPSKYYSVAAKPATINPNLQDKPDSFIAAYNILNDYTKGNSEFWTTFYIHRGRTHRKFVAELVNEIEKGDLPDLPSLMCKLNSYKNSQLSEGKPYNHFGSFNRRLNYIQLKIVEPLHELLERHESVAQLA